VLPPNFWAGYATECSAAVVSQNVSRLKTRRAIMENEFSVNVTNPAWKRKFTDSSVGSHDSQCNWRLKASHYFIRKLMRPILVKATKTKLSDIFFYFNVWTRREVHRAQAHTVCTTQIDKNRHDRFITALGLGVVAILRGGMEGPWPPQFFRWPPSFLARWSFGKWLLVTVIGCELHERLCSFSLGTNGSYAAVLR